jgi:hypothetical protein
VVNIVGYRKTKGGCGDVRYECYAAQQAAISLCRSGLGAVIVFPVNNKMQLS